MDYPGFDWKNPNYAAVFRQRLEVLQRIRDEPSCLPALKAYYKANPADFINDWGVTFDPRNAERDLPTVIPFVLFPKQREWIAWVIDRWRSRRPGLCEKSRECGVTWLAVGLSCTLCLHYEGVTIGFGSRKTEYVDKIGEMKPILPKARMFMECLPIEFRGGWVGFRDAPYMRIVFPETGSLIGGEGGDDIGRGDRASAYFFDEAAHHPHQELVEASLSQTTNCRIDISSVRGMNNLFARKRHEGKIDVFVFDWHDDPRKDDAWYKRQCEDLDPVVVAQEIDRDYSASVSGIVIPGEWVRACIDAAAKLGVVPTGARTLAFDVADEGVDKNAVCGGTGIEIEHSEDWSGKGADIFASTERVFEICDERGYAGFRYDADGLGADVRGNARVINERRVANRAPRITAVGFRGSEGVFDPDGIVEGTIGREGDEGRTNKDYFANRKAQGWWTIRRRIQKTWRWVTQGVQCKPDEIVSISKKCPNYLRLVAELSQPTYRLNEVGKIIIQKKPDGMKSPNLADAAMIRSAPLELPPLAISSAVLQQIAAAGRRPRIGS